MKIKVCFSIPNEKKQLVKSDNQVELTLPLTILKSSSYGDAFTMQENGRGKYFGPTQMFGGPKGGELVLFDNYQDRKFYAIILFTIQTNVYRKGDIFFFCFEDEIVDRIMEGVINSDNSYEDVMNHITKLISFEHAADACVGMAKNKLKTLIESH